MVEEKKEIFEQGLDEYPMSIVIIENLFIFLWLVVGTILCRAFSQLAGWLYLAFGLIMVLVVMRILVCKNCYYHGKQCHTGWGKLSAVYCKQGELNRFGCGIDGVTPPIFYGLMALAPLIFGIISMVQSFLISTMIVLIIFLLIVVISSFVLRKKACAICKMKNLCPGSAAK